MADRIAQELEDWITKTFTDDRPIWKDEVVRRARDDRLPTEELAMLAELPLVKQTPRELVDEIERMGHISEPGGSAGGMNAGSSGERRPGAYGGGVTKRYGGDWGGGYQP